jgi:molybdenum cofactor cytidylyltransferase
VKVAGIVLAAGHSTRMGRNKLLLRSGSESLVRRAARVAVEAGLDPVLVVLGHEAGLILAELAGLACVPVANARHALGLNTSLDAGLAAVPSDAAAAAVLLADMPLVSPAMLRALVSRHRETGAPLVSSRYGGTVAPPVLYARAVFAELRGGLGEGRGREVLRRRQAEASYLDWPAAALADVDEPADLARAVPGATEPT